MYTFRAIRNILNSFLCSIFNELNSKHILNLAVTQNPGGLFIYVFIAFKTCTACIKQQTTLVCNEQYKSKRSFTFLFNIISLCVAISFAVILKLIFNFDRLLGCTYVGSVWKLSNICNTKLFGVFHCFVSIKRNGTKIGYWNRKWKCDNVKELILISLSKVVHHAFKSISQEYTRMSNEESEKTQDKKIFSRKPLIENNYINYSLHDGINLILYILMWSGSRLNWYVRMRCNVFYWMLLLLSGWF